MSKASRAFGLLTKAELSGYNRAQVSKYLRAYRKLSRRDKRQVRDILGNQVVSSVLNEHGQVKQADRAAIRLERRGRASRTRLGSCCTNMDEQQQARAKELADSAINARKEFRIADERLNAEVQKAGDEGRLIRYGDQASWSDYEVALLRFNKAAAMWADYMVIAEEVAARRPENQNI